MRTNWFASGPTWCVRSTRRAIAFLSLVTVLRVEHRADVYRPR